MTKEELLKPRYKVIADYPGRKFELGEVFQYLKDTVTTRVYWLKKANHSFQTEKPFFDKYPHLFKKLEWWEHRIFVDAGHSGKYVKEFDVMPQFIKSRSTDNVYKVIWYSVDEFDEVSCLVEDGSQSRFRALQDMDISTLEEYSAYIKKQTTNG